MLPSASFNTATTQCRPHSMAAIFLLVLLAQQGTTQQARHKRDAPPAGYRTNFNFSCVGRAAGYYADISSGCQLYYMCDLEGRRFTHACPNGTLFLQRLMVCDHWYMVSCNKSELDYSANLLIGQRDKHFVSPEEHLHMREPVEFFTRRQNAFSVQQGSLVPEVTDLKQTYSAVIGSPVSDSGRLRDGLKEDRHSLDSTSAVQDPSTNRRARNRDINTSRSQSSNPQISTPSDSYSSVYFGTLPAAYTNNPFFQSLLLRTTPSTPQKPTDTPMSAELQDNSGAQLTESKTFADEYPELRDTADARVSHTQTLPQQSSHSKSSDLAFRLGIPDVESVPISFTQDDVPDTYINKPLRQCLSETNTLPLPTSIISPNIEQTSPQANYNFGENEDDFDNTVELHLLDHRRMFFIPDSDEDIEDRQTGNTTVLSISVPENSHIMHFRHNTEVTSGHNLDCPRCNPAFLVPGTCHPCVIIR